MTSTENKLKRKSNIEILRIVAMLMVVMGHYVYYGIMQVGTNDPYALYISGSNTRQIISAMLILGSFGVGIFFAISGYFSVSLQGVRLHSFIRICIQIVLYALISIAAYSCFKFRGVPLQGDTSQHLLTIINVLFAPLSGSQWWFATAYLVLMLIAPYYNQFLSKLNKRHKLLLLGYLYIHMYLFGKIHSNIYDLEVAVFYYTIGYYIRTETKEHKKFTGIFLFFIAVIVNGICQYKLASYSSGTQSVIIRKMFSFISEAVQPIGVAGILSCFIAIESGNIKIINNISKHTFGVYLFHCAPFIGSVIWGLLIDPKTAYMSGYYYIFLFLIPVIVFCFGVVVDCALSPIVTLISTFIEKKYASNRSQ